MTADAGGAARPFSASGRADAMNRLAGREYDLLIVGGGIVGAGIARDAAMRGLRVALVEQGDFASGTSSKSSKLLHGGLRYLEHGELKLVWEACHERARLGRLIPHLARPLRFLFPVYRGHPVGPRRLNLGLTLYDALAGLQNLGRHEGLSARAIQAREPRLREDGLLGGASYVDSVTDDARLTLETARSAWEHGADLVPYARAEELIVERGAARGARVVDTAEGGRADRWDVRARCVVNATGPWCDEVRRRAGRAGVMLRPTKGVHLMLPAARFPIEHAVVMLNPPDHRILFVIPWGHLSIVGTTDTDFAGSPSDVRASATDVDYVLAILTHYFPEAGFGARDVAATYAGLRPLIGDDAAAASQVSREHRIVEEMPGLVTVAGGKLTTYRVMSAQVVDRVAGLLRQAGGASSTDREPIAPPPGPIPTDRPEALWDHLAGSYGGRADSVCAVTGEVAHGSTPIHAGAPDVMGQAIYAARQEMALHLDDVLSRRTHALLGGVTMAEAAAVAAVMAGEMGWDGPRRDAELERFRRSWEGAHGWRRAAPDRAAQDLQPKGGPL